MSIAECVTEVIIRFQSDLTSRIQEFPAHLVNAGIVNKGEHQCYNTVQETAGVGGCAREGAGEPGSPLAHLARLLRPDPGRSQSCKSALF